MIKNFSIDVDNSTDIYIHEDAEFKVEPEIGSHVAIDKGVYVTVRALIGCYTHIGPSVTIVGGRAARFQCFGFNNIMAGARIICGSDRFDSSGLFGAMIPPALRGRQIVEPVVMEEFSNVGTNAIVLPGSTLRKGVLLTAGSMLIGDTEEWGVYKGNPAKLVKKIASDEIVKRAKILGYAP